MVVTKQKYYFFLLVFLLFPFSLRAAWSEPSGPPPAGNVPTPVYTVGSGQALTGSLVVTEISGTGLQVTGNAVGIQGNSANNAVYGNTTTGGSGGYAGIYGTAFDANDFAGNFTGGAGIAVQGGAMPAIAGVYVQAAGGEIVSTGGYALGGNVVFNNQGTGIAWPRESDGASLYGVYVSPTGELQVRGHGAGINLTDQNNNSRLTMSEAGATNVVTGPLTVGGTAVCLADGSNCPAGAPAPPTPTLYSVLTQSSDASGFTGDTRIGGRFYLTNNNNNLQAAIDFDPYNLKGNQGYFLVKSGELPAYNEKWHMRINRTGETLLGGNLFIGKGGGVGSMVPVTDPTANVSWKIGLVGGVNTIETNPGGGDGDVGNINLKSGALNVKYINTPTGDILVNDTLDVQFGIKNSGDIFLVDDKSIRIDANNHTDLIFGNYNGNGGAFTYGGTYNLNLAAEGDIKANRLCFGDADCKASWAEIVQGGGGGAQTLLQVLQTGANASAFAGLTAIGGNVGLGASAVTTSRLKVTATGNMEGLYVVSGAWSPIVVRNSVDSADLFRVAQTGQVGIGVTPTARLHVKPVGNEEGIRVISGSWSPLVIRNTADSADLFRVDQTGRVGIGMTAGRTFEVKGDTNNNPGEFLVTFQNINPNNGASLALITPQAAGASGGYAVTAFRRTDTGGDGWNVGMGPADNVYRITSRVATVNTERLVIDQNTGKIGINVSIPSSLLHIKPTGNVEGLRVISGAWSPLVVRNAADSADLFRVDETGKVTSANSYCIGANCKTGWGPNSGVRQYKQIPAPPNSADIVCDAGYVMVGIKNTPTAEIICDRMW